MSSGEKKINTRLTEAYREAQKDEKFQGWLKYQEAAFELEFSLDQVPELPDDPFTREGLAIAEQKALILWDSPQAALAEASRSLAFRFVYFIGQTFVQNFEGTWVNLPRPDLGVTASQEDVDLPFDTGFYDPRGLFRVALHRRTGKEWARVFGFAKEDYDKWVTAGRPERVLT